MIYNYIFNRVTESVTNKGALQAANFWGFGGQGRANKNGNQYDSAGIISIEVKLISEI